MENYREVSIMPRKTVSDAATETIDFNVDEPITSLNLVFRVVNTTSVSTDVPPENCISKIEIVDGGTVYYSASGPEAVAIAVYESGRWPWAFYNDALSGEQIIRIPLYFGRFLGDEEFAFSPTKLLNPQLKVTWSKNAKHATGGVSLGVYAHLMQGVAPPTKALFTKSVRAFTTAASGIELTDLPVDRDYRRLFVRDYRSTGFFAEDITHYKLDCDTGKLVVFDWDVYEFAEYIRDQFGPVERTAQVYVTDDAWYNGWLGNILGAALNSIFSGHIVSAWSATGSAWQALAEDRDGTELADEKCNLTLHGCLPHSTLCYQFGRKDEPATWFKASKYGQVRLEMTQGVADCAVDLLLQQPRSLP